MEITKGKFYGVSIGPGDPELMTLKAKRILESCDVIAVPKTHGEKMQAFEIAAQVVDLSKKEILPIAFSMAREIDKRYAYYEEAANRIKKLLLEGKDVALITIGDIGVYSTCSYILQLLKQKKMDTESIPGVPSFCAAACALEESLCEMDEELHILPASSSTFQNTLSIPGTKVVMKAGSQIEKVRDMLKKADLLEHTKMVINCGMENEQIVEDLHNLPEEKSYFSTLIIKG